MQRKISFAEPDLERISKPRVEEKDCAKALKKLHKTGSIEIRPESGHPKSERIEENINAVEQLILTQEGKPGTSCSERQVAKGHEFSIHLFGESSKKTLT